MPKPKGNAYDATSVVAKAVELCRDACGWSPETFFANAKKFGGMNGFDAISAAKQFGNFLIISAMYPERTIPAPEIPAPVITLANWILVLDPERLQSRLQDRFP